MRHIKISLLTVRNQLTGGCNAKELCVLSGGGLHHHSDICLDGSRFAMRAAHQAGKHRAFSVFSLRSWKTLRATAGSNSRHSLSCQVSSMHPHLTRFSADLWGPLSASAGFLLFIFSEHDASGCTDVAGWFCYSGGLLLLIGMSSRLESRLLSSAQGEEGWTP